MNKNYCFLIFFLVLTIFITTINPMKHTLGFFHSVENPFMNEIY